MTTKIKQFRYYGENNSKNYPSALNITNLTSGSAFDSYIPIIQLGIQALPGLKFSLNNNNDPIIMGITGIYELDLSNSTGTIINLQFNQQSIELINENKDAYLIIDIVYQEG